MKPSIKDLTDIINRIKGDTIKLKEKNADLHKEINKLKSNNQLLEMINTEYVSKNKDILEKNKELNNKIKELSKRNWFQRLILS